MTGHQMLAGAAAVLGLSAVAADARPPADVVALAADVEAERDHVTAPELASWIMRGDSAVRVFDLRPLADFERFHIPSAAHATLASLVSADLPASSRIVLYSEGGAHAAQAWMLLRMRGYRDVFFLREGLYEWLARVHEPRLAVDASAQERHAFDQAVEMSRYFGGVARADVPRAEVPVGYWTSGAAAAGTADGVAADGAAAGAAAPARAHAIVAGIRRRGC
jgi:rhodanese-related sulfurtransferase